MIDQFSDLFGPKRGGGYHSSLEEFHWWRSLNKNIAIWLEGQYQMGNNEMWLVLNPMFDNIYVYPYEIKVPGTGPPNSFISFGPQTAHNLLEVWPIVLQKNPAEWLTWLNQLNFSHYPPIFEDHRVRHLTGYLKRRNNDGSGSLY